MGFRKLLYDVAWKPFLQRYLRNDRRTRLYGFDLLVKRGVFHPRFFFSSRCFFEFLRARELRGTFLEIGCGSGLLSLLAARKGAIVTAVDINQQAVECTRLNFMRNMAPDLDRTILHSDVFSAVPARSFDTVVVNPPYFFRNAYRSEQLAWNCGEGGEFFHKLFRGIAGYMHSSSQAYMILADNCEIERISAIASEYSISLREVLVRKMSWEMNYIFAIEAHRG